jgi:KaiC/GvpD/RAD55 family RecA-like ATPase
MNFVDKRKTQNGIKSLGDLQRDGKVTGKNDPTKYVNGPVKIDCLARPWHRGDLSGILAGPGVGKTTFVLYMFKHILLNNPEGVVAFVSLEMTASEIAEKWFKATEECPEIADRFYVVENYDDEGKSRDLTGQQIKYELKKIKETLGQTIHAFALDHLHEININGGVDYNPVCKELKNMAVELDTHGFILSQTTKGKGIGDIPVPKDGCYGTSRFEWLMTNILTIFQPLKRVQKECDLPVLAWQYAKIRYKNAKDKVKEDMNYLLRYDFVTEDLVDLDRNEKTDFALYYEKVLELRQNEEKFKSFQFDLSTEVKGENGKVVKLEKIVGGSKPQSLDDDL